MISVGTLRNPEGWVGRILHHVWIAAVAVAVLGWFQIWDGLRQAGDAYDPTSEWVVSHTVPGMALGTALADHELRNQFPDLLLTLGPNTAVEPVPDDAIDTVPRRAVLGLVLLLALLMAPALGVTTGSAEAILSPAPGWRTIALRAALVAGALGPLALLSGPEPGAALPSLAVAGTLALGLAAVSHAHHLVVRVARIGVLAALALLAAAPLGRIAAARPYAPTPGIVQRGSELVRNDDAARSHRPEDDWQAPSPSGVPEPGRVIVIAVDTLGANHVSANGYAKPTTPRIAEMAEREGIVFERNHASAPWTLPSTTSLFTSLHPHQHGVEEDGRRLHEEVPTLAGVFAGQGWHTAALITHFYVSSKFGLDSGFAEFWELALNRAFFEGQQLTAQQLGDRVLPWLRENRERPFLLYLHYFDPHWDYEPPPPFDTAFTDPAYRGRADGTWDYMRHFVPVTRPMDEDDLAHCAGLYDGEIAYTDHHIGRVFEEMKRLGIWDDALVVIVADHGEELKEHQSLGHSHTVYEEQVWVPLIVKLPGGRPEGWRSRVSEQTRSVDVAPTLMELAGLRAPPGLVGESLVPLMRAPGEDRDSFSRTRRGGRRRVMVTHSRWKLIRNDDQGGTEELYDLRNDPGEQTNVLEEHQEIASDLRHRLESVLEDPAGAGGGRRFRQDVQIGEDERAALEALGYVH